MRHSNISKVHFGDPRAYRCIDCDRTRTRTRETRAHAHERTQRYAPNGVGRCSTINLYIIINKKYDPK